MAATATLRDLHDELRERVAALAGQLDVPGVVVGITSGDEEDYVAHGIASVVAPLPVDEGTLFQIGSTGKTLTATAIMALVERGQIDLDAPVRRYIPTLRLQDASVAERVTVLQLLNHTSGWAGDFFLDTGYGDDALARYVERLAEARQEHPLGERVSYSNSALSLAGRVIEVVTGQPFEDAVRELVFEPIGLTEHFYYPWEVMIRPFAVGHVRGEGGLRVTPWYEPRSGHPQGGGICASARDQLRYARFHMRDGGVLRPETLRRMQTLTTPGGGTEGFGISWMLRELDGVRIVAHGGSTAGHQSSFEMAPERRFAIVGLTNARHGNELLHELLTWVREAYLGLSDPLPEPLTLSPDELAAYTGVFSAHMGEMTISVEGEHLLATFEPNPSVLAEMGMTAEEIGLDAMPLAIVPDDGFLILDGQYRGMRGKVLRDDSGRVHAFDLGRVFTRKE